MRTLLKVALFLAGTALVILTVGFCWLYFYSRDLPDVAALAQYAPATETQVSDPCLGSSVAISYEAIGVNVRYAISAVEVREDDPGVLQTELSRSHDLHRRTLSAAISRSICYAASRELRRQFAEIRTAIQLERHYARQQLFTMYANRANLGSDLIGAQQASEFYFHKSPGELTLQEAALLAGLIRSPAYLSPLKHPDRALRRRNAILDTMAQNGSITAVDAQAAKAAPLGVVASVTPSAQ